MGTIQLQHKKVGEFQINHRKKADEALIELLESIQDSVNLAIKDGAERIELRYLNVPYDITNQHGDTGSVRVFAYRETVTDKTPEA